MSTTPTTLRSLEPASMRPGPTVREGFEDYAAIVDHHLLQ